MLLALATMAGCADTAPPNAMRIEADAVEIQRLQDDGIIQFSGFSGGVFTVNVTSKFLDLEPAEQWAAMKPVFDSRFERDDTSSYIGIDYLGRSLGFQSAQSIQLELYPGQEGSVSGGRASGVIGGVSPEVLDAEIIASEAERARMMSEGGIFPVEQGTRVRSLAFEGLYTGIEFLDGPRAGTRAWIDSGPLDIRYSPE